MAECASFDRLVQTDDGRQLSTAISLVKVYGWSRPHPWSPSRGHVRLVVRSIHICETNHSAHIELSSAARREEASEIDFHMGTFLHWFD
jgi:hypothetical protein